MQVKPAGSQPNCLYIVFSQACGLRRSAARPARQTTIYRKTPALLGGGVVVLVVIDQAAGFSGAG